MKYYALILFLSLLAGPSLRADDYLIDRWSDTPGKVFTADAEKIRVWFDTRRMKTEGVIQLLVTNDGPNDVFLCQNERFWFTRPAGSHKSMAVMAGTPQSYFRLSPSGSGFSASATGVVEIKPAGKEEIAMLAEPGAKAIVTLEVIGRKDGKSHIIEVECE